MTELILEIFLQSIFLIIILNIDYVKIVIGEKYNPIQTSKCMYLKRIKFYLVLKEFTLFTSSIERNFYWNT